MEPKFRCVHFVGFRGNEYNSAVRVWGPPHFIHMGWDKRAQRDIGSDDLVIFARGTADDPPRDFNYDDIWEQYL